MKCPKCGAEMREKVDMGGSWDAQTGHDATEPGI